VQNYSKPKIDHNDIL